MTEFVAANIAGVATSTPSSIPKQSKESRSVLAIFDGLGLEKYISAISSKKSNSSGASDSTSYFEISKVVERSVNCQVSIVYPFQSS